MIRPDQETLTIQVGGAMLSGWLECSVTRSVEICPSAFTITTSEKYPGQASQIIAPPGSPCTISISGDKVLTGYVDGYLPSYDPDNHTVRIVGRSKTEDIVDCSVDVDAVGWEIFGGLGAAIRSIAEKCCAPYGVGVVTPDGDGPLPTGSEFSVYPGYTGYQLLEEMARATGMLIWDDANGNLVISKAGTAGRAASALVEGTGGNIKFGDAAYMMSERFSVYRVVSQIPDKFGHQSIYATANPGDAGVPRYRLKIIPSETPLSAEYIQTRANWERSMRYGRSRQARVTVVGWRDGAGNLWQPNSIVGVSAPNLKLIGDRVISEVTYHRSNQGTLTHITLIEQAGLTPAPFFAIDKLGTTATTPGAPGGGNAAP